MKTNKLVRLFSILLALTMIFALVFYSKYACTGTPHGHLAKLDGTIYQWKEKRQQSPNGFDPRHDSCRGTGIGGSVNKRRDMIATLFLSFLSFALQMLIFKAFGL